MKITYTGKYEDLTAAQQHKLEVKFAKLSKLLDHPRGEREAHVILTNERHLHLAELNFQFHDHAVAVTGSGADLFEAISAAVEKAEKQVLRLREKWRDTKRGPKETWTEEAEAPEPATPGPVAAQIETESGTEMRVFRVNHHNNRKPMTLEEALLAIEDRPYIVYRDAETNRVSVLVRRRDGHFDLVEA